MRGNGDRHLEGLRERKRRETAQRIADAGLRLFIANGYDATTLDAIAAEAGISRRTFFYYFKSKDEILLSLMDGADEMIAAALRDEPSTKRPLEAARDALVRICARYPADEMIIIDRLMRSSEAVQARKQANYVRQEKALFAALCEKWPGPEANNRLQLIAMMSIGAMRLSLETLYREEGKRPLPVIVIETFATLETEI
jgi:AcrR family transcriptional regulator